MSDIDALRRQIDAIDAKLVELLNARAACAVEIGRLKELAGLPVYQPAREAEVLEHVRAAKAIEQFTFRNSDTTQRIQVMRIDALALIKQTIAPG